MRFDELTAGRVIETDPYELTKDDLLSFARAWDPQWFHTDEARADQGPFGGLIASGWQTCAIAMRLVVERVLHDSESYASPGLERVRWPHPVRPGDRLRLTLTVLEQRRSRSQPTLGIVRWRWQLRNAEQREVLDLEATSLFALATLTDER